MGKTKFYLKQLKNSKETINILLKENANYKDDAYLLRLCDIDIVNTIQLLMYIGRDIDYYNIQEPEDEPILWYAQYVEDYAAYDNTDKEIEIDCIVGKQDYKKWIGMSVELLKDLFN